MPLPLLEFSTVYHSPLSPSWIGLESFWFDGHEYLGAQGSSWEASELAWDNGDPAWGTGLTVDPQRGYGRWHGPAALHTAPQKLWVQTPAQPGGVSGQRIGHDDVARVPTNMALTLTWDDQKDSIAKVYGGLWHVVFQSAATGAVLLSTTKGRDTLNASLNGLSAHAIAWVRLEGATLGWQLPPDYLTARGFSNIPARFQYRENGEDYVWDYEADVGRRPSDRSQLSFVGEVMWDAYLSLIESGGLVHIGEWSQYIVDGANAVQSGPWSAVRIAVGSDPFTVGANFVPYPGAALSRITDESTLVPVTFDPLACSISAFEVMAVGAKAGQARIGGTIATRSGPASAYWHFHPTTNLSGSQANLLGIGQKDYTPMCEASLYPEVADILELQDGSEWVLTFSHLYLYDPNVADVTLALPGIPAATGGHPGGRCLRTTEGTLKFFTEYFGNVGAPIGNDAYAQFYNTLRTLDPRANATSGKGTVFHGHNAAEVCWGFFYGWAQDKDFSQPTAQQFLAYLQNGTWVSSGMAGFPASDYHWQRARRITTKQGTKLVVSGKATHGEGALWGLADGQEFQEGALYFRPRRLTRVKTNQGERIYCTGRFVTKTSNGTWVCSLAHSVIALTGYFKTQTFTWNPLEQGFCTSLADATANGLDPAHMAPYLWWIVDLTQSAGGYWLPKETIPTDGSPYLRLNVDATHDELCYILENGPLPYDPTKWPTIKVPIDDIGGIGPGAISPQPGPENAQDAKDGMPDDTRVLIVQQDVPANTEWDTLQVSDVNALDAVSRLPLLWNQERKYLTIWLRVDSTAPANDLTSYDTYFVWNQERGLPATATHRVDICVLCAPELFTGGKTIVAPTPEPTTATQLPVAQIQFL